MAAAKPTFSAEIQAFYEVYDEAGRLETGPFRLEFLRTKELLARVLPPPPATVLDVGGGPGVYAAWLARQGYRVHLVDAVARHVAQAEARSRRQPQAPLASCTVGDARALGFDDGSAEAVLLLGPLYHLTERAERLAALAEARRVLKPGGCLVAAAISRYASALDGLSGGAQGPLTDPVFWAMVQQDLDDGQHRNTTRRIDYFTEAYFHRVEEVAEEITAAGFQEVETLAVEGPGWLLADLDAWLADDAHRERLLAILRRLETEPTLLGVSAHLLGIARR